MQPYTKTDQRLHWLSQVIAKANRTFVPKEEDDSHTNLYYDSLGNRITGRWIKSDYKSGLFTLNLSNQHFEVLNSALKTSFSIQTVDRKLPEVEEEIEKLLPSIGLSSEGFLAGMHFKIPDYGFGNKPIQAIKKAGLEDWKHYRQLANEACNLFLGHTQLSSEVRIWPHHFDTGIYVVVNEKVGFGFGLAMEDNMVGAPYLYVTGYSKNESIIYENLPEGGHWYWELNDNWQGAVLPIDKLEKEPEAEEKKIINNFILKTLGWFASISPNGY
jgi:hypothetical protein